MNVALKKAISYRIISFALSLIFAYIWFGNLKNSITFTVISAFLATIVYYFHEKWWTGCKKINK